MNAGAPAEKPTVKDAAERLGEYSSQLSTIIRSLVLASLALVWFFKDPSAGEVGYTIPKSLYWAALFFIISMATDYVQYLVGGIAWFLALQSAPNGKMTTQVDVPSGSTAVLGIVFALKCILSAVGLIILLFFLGNNISMAKDAQTQKTTSVHIYETWVRAARQRADTAFRGP